MIRQLLQIRLVLTLAGLAQILVACGGESDSEVAAADANITASGVTTEYGSISVNGIHVYTETSEISIDGSPGFESSFAIGIVGGNASINAPPVVRKDIFSGNTLNRSKGSISNLDTTGRTFNYDAGTAF